MVNLILLDNLWHEYIYIAFRSEKQERISESEGYLDSFDEEAILITRPIGNPAHSETCMWINRSDIHAMWTTKEIECQPQKNNKD